MSENTDNYNPKAEIEKIERRFEHQNFAKDFCAAAESQKNIVEIEIRNDSEIHYKQVRFNMYSKDALFLLTREFGNNFKQIKSKKIY